VTPETPARDECWIQIGIEATSRTADEVAEALTRAGALSVSFEDGADDAILEPGPGETPLWNATVVVGLFDGGVDAETVLDGLRLDLGLPARPGCRIDAIHGREWERAWRQHFEARRFGARLWVSPFDHRIEAPGAAVVYLDPGLAFGTGAHPTTALCLEWLDANCGAGDAVVDYGCGSGILAIAAARLGAAPVWAVDIDPQAVQAGKANAARNGVESAISVGHPDELRAVRADCLVANILAGPLIALMPRFAALLRPGGRLVTSGILAAQAPAVTAALRPAFEPGAVVEKEGWIRLDAVRR
jgi:ribosomal protein L11 methyltransferase